MKQVISGPWEVLPENTTWHEQNKAGLKVQTITNMYLSA